MPWRLLSLREENAAKPMKGVCKRGCRGSTSLRVVKLLRVVNVLCVIFLVWLGSLGFAAPYHGLKESSSDCECNFLVRLSMNILY